MHCGSCSRPSCAMDPTSFTTPGASWVPVRRQGATVAPSDCRTRLGWRVCCSYGRRFNSRWLPVCLFLVSVYLRLTPCLHVTHRHLPPGHIAEQASFLAGWPMSAQKIIFSQRFKGCCAFRVPPVEELKWLLKNQHVLQLLPLQCLNGGNGGSVQTKVFYWASLTFMSFISINVSCFKSKIS